MPRKAQTVGNRAVMKLKGGYNYGFTKKERLIYTLAGIAQLSALGYIFYKSVVMVAAFQLLLPLYLRYMEEECRRKHTEQLKCEFKELLDAYQSFISTGYSADNALELTRAEMISLGFAKGAAVAELEYMIRQMKLNVPISELFREWGRRSGLKDIEDFAEIFEMSEYTGGNTARLIKECASAIGEKMDVERDIGVILAARKYEQRVINIVPLLILLYVDFTSGGFLDVLYKGLPGRLVMTVCLAVYLCSFVISNKIMDIEV